MSTDAVNLLRQRMIENINAASSVLARRGAISAAASSSLHF
jgi:hypothetical protein